MCSEEAISRQLSAVSYQPSVGARFRSRFAGASAVLVLLTGSAVAGPGAYPTIDLPTQFADEDAVILRWDQSWSIGEDHSIVRREVKHTLIRNDRAIGAFADPRITYNADWQTVNVLKARTVLPDGRVVEVPDYASNVISPHGVAGWPAFSGVRQLVISFGGIEPGAVLEFEWELTTKPGMWRWPEIERRLNVRYPTLSRTIRTPGAQAARQWANLPPMRDEPQSIPWRDRCECFVHSTCPSPVEWIRSVLKQIEIAAEPVAAVKPVAMKWAAGKTDPVEIARSIQQKLKKQFRFVNVPAHWVPDRHRRADAVMASHYASAPEAAGLLLSLYRAAGLNAEPFFVTRDENAGAITAAITAYGVSVKTEDGVTHWHASEGRVREPGPWGGRKRYDNGAIAGSKGKPAVFAAPNGSALTIFADVTIDTEARWTADVEIKATGLFIPGGEVRTQKGKKAAVKAILDRLLPDAELGDCSVTTLSDEVFAVTARAKAKSPLPDLHGEKRLTLPQAGPWTQRFGIPLGRSQRKSTLRLAGPFRQTVRLVFTLPEGWTASVLPLAREGRIAEDGVFVQQVEATDDRVTLDRTVEIAVRDIPPDVFPNFRDAANALQTEAARTLILRH